MRVPNVKDETVSEPADVYTRKSKYITIGIPSVARKKENYLHKTLKSLLENMDKDERKDVTIVVLYADSDTKIRHKRLKETMLLFNEYVRSGLLLLIQTYPEIYPPMKITRRTYNDTIERIAWRSKQVLDFAYLLKYSKSFSEYFLILEDDIESSPHFVSAIQRFIRTRENSEWVSLTFSSFYIIGRLFKSEDLRKLSEFLVLFHLEKPVDLLILQFLDIMVPEKKIVTRRIPGLFQHMGLYSSLDGKIQKAKDRSFSNNIRVYHFPNPPADVVTTIGVYKKHYPEYCYDESDKFFWGSAPKRNDTFDVILRKPAKVRRIFVSSGLPSHKEDIIRYAELKVATVFKKMLTDRKAVCSEFNTVALFEMGKADATVNTTLPKENIQCIRIEFIKKQSNWLLINEISVDIEPTENY
ncbi:alpha-1,3-mannosyl-glycoprotein 4-beta-N-acetylglucosaminyltransferase C-like isoform X2 [Parasteatoda tepidariorum]|uniref:alpha-1,3-mannosyl-glycoprotein 4-beta-N-acetylglucosaminyltransferase C-like isoform X2 n=1 Tax=Parasteatoda tepidariorum TaxID=114398 RepID=UPI0039BC4780